MSVLSRPAARWSALIGLWALVIGVLWVLLVQAFLLALNPFCHMQPPGIARVTVVSVDRDADSQLTDFVSVKEGEAERILRMTKAEAGELHSDDEVWILHAWYTDGLRPTQFRLTPLRLLLEYPILLLLPIAFGLWRVRKAQQQADAAPPQPVRRTFTDDFHLRAQRFAKPEATEVEGAVGKANGPPVPPDEQPSEGDRG